MDLCPGEVVNLVYLGVQILAHPKNFFQPHKDEELAEVAEVAEVAEKTDVNRIKVTNVDGLGND